MGRMLDALKRAENTHGEADEQRSGTRRVAVSAQTESVSEDTEEIPFIEVGPRKSMEASASVLACAPVPVLFHPPVAPARESVVDAAVSLALPAARSVQFRALPNRIEPRSRFAPELVAYHAPQQPAARQYQEVLDAVLNASAAREHPAALLFTSARPRTGTTTTLLNVAITAARQGRRRVVVVDANLQHPSIADRLGLPAAPGLREALAGAVSLEEIIQPTEQANLFALTAGIRENVGIRFVAETMRSLLRQLRQSFPLVFVDGPSWNGQKEGTVLADACDTVYLVAPEQEAESPQIDALVQHISTRGARLGGCILVADVSRCP